MWVQGKIPWKRERRSTPVFLPGESHGQRSLSSCFPGGSEDTASACNSGDLGSIPGLGGSPGEGNGNPLQYSCLERRSLVGYSPRGRKESDTTEQLHFPLSTEGTTLRVNSNVHSGLCVIVISQCSFTSCNKWTNLMWGFFFFQINIFFRTFLGSQ